MSFIEGLGKGQMISRQGLTSPYLGDIQLSLCDRRGNLEVEVIRARGLSAKTNKIQPRKYYIGFVCRSIVLIPHKILPIRTGL